MSERLQVSNTTAIALFCWYIAIFAGGAFVLVNNLCLSDFETQEVTLAQSLTCSIGAALLSSSLYYVRKLYKELFIQQIDSGKSLKFNSIELATFFYFVSRPLFAVLFAILVVITSATFVHAVTTHGTKLSLGFIYFSILLSAYGAAATGRFVRQLEALGLEKLRTFGSST
jgi:hypothetical protein